MELAGKPQLTDRSHASSIIEQLAVRMRTTVKNYVVENFTKRVVSWCQAKVALSVDVQLVCLQYASGALIGGMVK